MSRRIAAALTVLFALAACSAGEEDGVATGDTATGDTAAGEEAAGESAAQPTTGGDPSLLVVDAAGGVSRLVRIEPGASAPSEVASLPDGGRGLAWWAGGERIVWASRDADVIQSSALDGTGVETLPLTGHDSAYAVAVGARSGDLYWSDYGRDEILRWNGTSDGPTVLASGLVSPRAIAVDEEDGWVYWVDRGAGRLERAPVTGGDTEVLISEGLAAPYGLALDPVDGSLLVADAELGSIFRYHLPVGELESWLPEAGTHPSFVWIDAPTDRVYWTDNRDNVVRWRARSGGPVQVIAEGLAGPRGFVLVR